MPLTLQHRNTFTYWWVIFFYVLAIIKWWQGLWLFQFDPFMFTTRFDGTTWLFMQTGLHLMVLQSNWAALMLDVLFYSFPFIYLLFYLRKPTTAPKIAWLWLIINWIYVQCYTLYPTNSIEAHIPWLLFPILFCSASLKSFYFVMQGLRYFFLYFFLSAGIWKLVNGGAFQPAQMSAILMDQHKDFLITSPDYWQSKLIYLLISMPVTAFILYWIGIIIELTYVIGFFSRRYDRLLVILFILFLVFDHLLMRIPYVEVTPFLLPLLYSHYGMPDREEVRVV